MLLKPDSIAVIGASSNPKKVGGVIFNNLLKSRLRVYPVNPNHKSINGVKCYKSIKELKVSHAVIAVPAMIVPQVISECVEAGVKVAIIISSGFAEVGNKELQDKIISIARTGGLRIIGPNSLGLIVPGEFNASFFKGELKSGGTTFISQSGALGVGVLDSLVNNNGLRAFVSVGNKADININDVLIEAINDDKTKSIMIYAESLINGKEFMSIVKKSSKPVFILKGGLTSKGATAASTHTGSMAGDSEVFKAAMKQCGARSVNSLRELINSSITYEQSGLIGNKALIITNAGGPGILTTDALINNEFIIPELPKRVVKELSNELVGINWSKHNPIDIVGDATAKRYANTLRVINKYDFYDFMIIILTPQAMSEPLMTAKEIIKINKRVFTCMIGGESVKQAIKLLRSNNKPVFNSISELINTLRNLVLHQQ